MLVTLLWTSVTKFLMSLAAETSSRWLASTAFTSSRRMVSRGRADPPDTCCNKNDMLWRSSSVADPDPHVFGPPGSGSTSQRYGSGSGSFYNHAGWCPGAAGQTRHPHPILAAIKMTCYEDPAVLRIRIRMFLGLPDPDPLVRSMDPDPDPSIIMNK